MFRGRASTNTVFPYRRYLDLSADSTGIGLFAAQTEWLPTRRQHDDPRARGQEVGDDGGGLDDVLKIVEQEQQSSAAKIRLDTLNHRPPTLILHSARLGDGRWDERSV